MVLLELDGHKSFKMDYSKLIIQLNNQEWHGHATESLWATSLTDSWFKIENSPFFSTMVSYNDVVSVKTENGLLSVSAVVKRGGHSTYMILMEKDIEGSSLWTEMNLLGCSYESMQINLSIGARKLYSIDVPPTTDIFSVYDLLKEGELSGQWAFQEGNVGHRLNREKSGLQ